MGEDNPAFRERDLPWLWATGTIPVLNGVEEFLIDRAGRAREGRRLIASKELPRTRKGRQKSPEGGLPGGNSTRFLSRGAGNFSWKSPDFRKKSGPFL